MDGEDSSKSSSSGDVDTTKEKEQNSRNEASNADANSLQDRNEEPKNQNSSAESLKSTEKLDPNSSEQNEDENDVIQEISGTGKAMTEDSYGRNTSERRVSIADPPTAENSSSRISIEKGNSTKKNLSSQDINKKPRGTLDESDVVIQDPKKNNTSEITPDGKRRSSKKEHTPSEKPSREPSIQKITGVEADKPLSRKSSKQETHVDEEPKSEPPRKGSDATKTPKNRESDIDVSQEVDKLPKRSSSGKIKSARSSKVDSAQQNDTALEAVSRGASATRISDELSTRRSATRQVADEAPSKPFARDSTSRQAADLPSGKASREGSVTRQTADAYTPKPPVRDSTSRQIAEEPPSRSTRDSQSNTEWRGPETAVRESSSRQLSVAGEKPKRDSGQSTEITTPKQRQSAPKLTEPSSERLSKDLSTKPVSKTVLTRDKSTQTVISMRSRETETAGEPWGRMEPNVRKTPETRDKYSQYAPSTKAPKERAPQPRSQAPRDNQYVQQKRGTSYDKRLLAEEALAKEIEGVRLRRLQYQQKMEKRRQESEARLANKSESSVHKKVFESRQVDKKSRETLLSDKKGKDEDGRSVSSKHRQEREAKDPPRKSAREKPGGEPPGDIQKDQEAELARRNAARSRETISSKSSRGSSKLWPFRSRESMKSRKKDTQLEEDKKKNHSRTGLRSKQNKPNDVQEAKAPAAYTSGGRAPSVVANKQRPPSQPQRKTSEPDRPSGGPPAVQGETSSTGQAAETKRQTAFSQQPSSRRQSISAQLDQTAESKQSVQSQQPSGRRQSVSNNSETPRQSSKGRMGSVSNPPDSKKQSVSSQSSHDPPPVKKQSIDSYSPTNPKVSKLSTDDRASASNPK